MCLTMLSTVGIHTLDTRIPETSGKISIQIICLSRVCSVAMLPFTQFSPFNGNIIQKPDHAAWYSDLNHLNTQPFDHTIEHILTIGKLDLSGIWMPVALLLIYSNYLNTGLVWYLNGRLVSGC